MFEYIKADTQRYLDIDGREHNSLTGRIFVLFFAYGLHATIVYRYGRYIERFSGGSSAPIYWFLNLFYLLFSQLIKGLYGISICRSAEIGKGFYVGHFGGIEVSHCKIGDICNIHQLTKVMDNALVGNYVWIGAHAVIEEGVILEDHTAVVVAARVTQTVSSHCLVSGNPARTIKINFDNSEMLGITAP